ncbi:MAG: TPM domain-containing protein [Novosphingobium sp.]|nr:TPM domain-containing protein [Novosphingobium sp.]
MLGRAGLPRLPRRTRFIVQAPSGLLLIAALLLATLALLAPGHAMAQQFPKLTGRVVDAANVIPPDAEARLTQKLATLETQSHRQLVVVTLPDLQGYDIADYGYQLGRAWGIGSKERNDGALLIVAPTERKLRIEVGYGLEGVLTDGLSSLIINQTIVPRFKAGDMPGGIEAGADAIIQQLTLPADQAQQIAQQANTQPEQIDFDPSWLVFGMFFVFFLVIPFFKTVHQRRRYGNAASSVFIWDMLSNMPRSSGGSSGGGGGGFSGGGGSFGGGGSSGSW